jgi:hypothetical protein
MLGCVAAVLAARGEKQIASVTFLASMLDFSEADENGLASPYVKRRSDMAASCLVGELMLSFRRCAVTT